MTAVHKNTQSSIASAPRGALRVDGVLGLEREVIRVKVKTNVKGGGVLLSD